MLTATQVRYAHERLRRIQRHANNAIRKKFTRTKIVKSKQTVLDHKAYVKASASMNRDYQDLRDRLMLGDGSEAMAALDKFAKKYGQAEY